MDSGARNVDKAAAVDPSRGAKMGHNAVDIGVPVWGRAPLLATRACPAGNGRAAV